MRETTASAIRSKVVKFIVNVRLMLKTLNSHVGRVMVVKVTIHNKRLGIELKKYQVMPKRAVRTRARPCCSSEDCNPIEGGAEAFTVVRRVPRADEVTADMLSEAMVDGCRRSWDHDFLRCIGRMSCLPWKRCLL